MNEARISKIAGRIVAIGIRSPDGPTPKFDVGDSVKTYSPDMTEVWEVGDWDEHLQDRRYLVMNPITRQKRWMNEKGMKKAGMKVANSQAGREAHKALAMAWDNLSLAQQRLRMVLNEDEPSHPEEIAGTIKDLEHLCWMVSVYKRQTANL